MLPYLINEDPPTPVQPPLANQVILTDVKVMYTDEDTYRYKNPCEQKSLCDTLKIHGDTIYCDTQQPKKFSVYKNPLCGSFAEWTIDTSAIAAMTVLNDTSVAFTFKNKKWSGKIYVSLSTGKCTSSIYDSLDIRIEPSPAPISFGADISLCPGNAVTLHAGPDFKEYKWQDNSADSIFTLTSIGTYFVQTKDFCGNAYSDTILVNPATYNFSLGPDVSKCNGDTLTLVATAGFSNYRWTPAYNIAYNNQSNTGLVFPDADTSYIVIADKGNGCVVKDTIHISVLHSPPINLGTDTILCEGSSLVLNVDAGFDQYKWSNGAHTQTLTAAAVGNYAVEALYQNGCSSRDTIRIMQIIPLPVFSLGSSADTVLCEGQRLYYNFNLNAANFLWNDGGTGMSKTISTQGLFWLKTTEQGCSYADSINVLFRPSPVVYLGNDTTLCEGTTKRLDATAVNGTYNWQDASTGSTYLVNGPGTYIVDVTENACTTSDTIVINYKLKPSISLGADQFICNGTQLMLQPVNAIAGDYKWQDGSTAASYTVKTPGIYSVISTNECGSTTDSVKIETGPCLLWLPSAFTPDNDGKNDLFRIKYVFPVNKFSLLVFNRWGQKVFETNDMSKGWDGKFNSIDQPQDVYIWIAKVTYPDNRKENLRGSVTLIR